MRGQECPLSLGSLSVYSVYSVVCSIHPESLRTAGTAVPTLRLAKRKKNGEDLSSPSFEKYCLAGLLAVTAGVLGFHCQRLLADALAEVSQLGPAYLALTVDDHLLDAR